MITLCKHHITVLNDWATILVQYMLLAELSKVTPCKHVSSGLVQWALIHEVLELPISMPIDWRVH